MITKLVKVMERLKQLLSILDAISSVECIKKTFSEIADILLFKSYIKTEKDNYRILEIEFYFKNNNHCDNVTIERTEDEDAGMWWLHDYGVDLSFKSKSENLKEPEKFYGGILIRSIIPFSENSGQLKEEKVICGPRKCCWYLFYSSAFESKNVPQIVMNDGASRHIGEMGSTTRYITRKPKKEDGDYRDSLYRFYVKGLNLKIESTYKKASPWK